jgi:hypothetical protein
LDASVYDLSQYDQGGVNQTLPDDARLRVHFFNWIKLQNKHTCENLLLCIIINVFGLGFYHVVFKFFHELEHQDT